MKSTLNGSIESAEKNEQMTKQAGKEIIKAKKEIKKSITETTQASGQYIDDSVITTSDNAVILNDLLLKVSKIKVTTVDDIRLLSGTLDPQASIDRALEVAKTQKNLNTVQNYLTLNVAEPRKE